MKVSPAPIIPYPNGYHVKPKKPDAVQSTDAALQQPVKLTVLSLDDAGFPSTVPAAYHRSFLLDIRV